MVIFLTSSFVEYQPKNAYVPGPLNTANGFGDNLRKYWMDNAHFLVFANDPSDGEIADHVTQEMYDAFSMAGFTIGEIKCFDNRAIEQYRRERDCDFDTAAEGALREAMKWADVFYLAGGHGPTENAFMKKCRLKELLNEPELFDGIFIGLSAGSLNAAEEVYLIPELPGESIDPAFVRFTDGLGLTSVNMVPHIDYEKTVSLDGRKLIDEIVAQDSFGRKIYLITDGSYFMIRNGITEFFGEGMIMEDGITRPLQPGIILSDDRRLRNAGPDCWKEYAGIFRTITSDYYDWVLELDSESGQIEFFHISSFMLENGIVPVNIDSFEELNRIFTAKLVVEEEKPSVLEVTQIDVILDELKKKGSYVRTIHIDNGDGVRAKNLRVGMIEGSTRRLLVCLTDISMVLDHDWMTDEYSRSGFIDKAERLLRDPQYAEGYSVVYTNIQGFKAVNDLLGTRSGDIVIFQERDALVRELEPVLIGRFESDHFVLITKTSNLTEDRLDRLCHRNYVEGSKQIPILIRCGIYHIRDTSRKIQYMLDQAKLAEKSISADHGVAYAVCDEKMSRDYVTRRLLISEIDSAFERGEFETYYQPVVDAKTGEIVSAEALIRWKHHERGMLSPGVFIPIFEKEGLLTRIDSFMVDRVLQFNRDRIHRGQKTVPCAVNLSRVDFYDTRLMNMMKRELGNQKDVRNLLKLEVTESAYAVLEMDAMLFLAEMKRLGLSLMLDDFGSGMSSLSTFESFEFDTIKLDMGFVSKIGKSVKAESIIRHTIGLSHDMGAEVVAEGVESREQLEFLQNAGCDMIQGYYFYKPMPEEEFAGLL